MAAISNSHQPQVSSSGVKSWDSMSSTRHASGEKVAGLFSISVALEYIDCFSHIRWVFFLRMVTSQMWRQVVFVKKSFNFNLDVLSKRLRLRLSRYNDIAFQRTFQHLSVCWSYISFIPDVFLEFLPNICHFQPMFLPRKKFGLPGLSRGSKAMEVFSPRSHSKDHSQDHTESDQDLIEVWVLKTFPIKNRDRTESRHLWVFPKIVVPPNHPF